MKDAEYASIAEQVTVTTCVCGVECHYVAMPACSDVDDVLIAMDIIPSIVNPHNVVFEYAVMLECNCLPFL
jgi:hypothetical protein